MAIVHRPRPHPFVSAVVLSGGGHVGFAPFAKDYFYSLIANYFDARVGVAASMKQLVAAPGPR
jgi:hypothetical protein